MTTDKIKDNVQLLIPEQDFDLIFSKLTKSIFSHGRSEGFLIGVVVANVVNVALQYLFKH